MTIAAALLALALAQETTIDADRPHVGTGPYVVEPAEVQFELGALWQGATDLRTFGSPALIRIGVVDRVEFRVSSDGLLARYQTAADVYGVGNAQLGAKIRLLGPRHEPFFSVMPTIGFGLASREKGLGAGATDATLTWLVAHSAGERLHIEGNYGIGAIGDRDSHFTQHLITGAVVVQTTKKLQTYIEDAWWSRQERGGPAVSFIDFGVIAALRSRLLVDAGAFIGVTSATPDWGVFSGVSFAIGGDSLHQQLRRGARADRQRPFFRAQQD
jgi:Putative MetA-pathway of phenol degradation